MCKFFFNSGIGDIDKLRGNLIALTSYSPLNTWLDMNIKELFNWILAINKYIDKQNKKR